MEVYFLILRLVRFFKMKFESEIAAFLNTHLLFAWDAGTKRWIGRKRKQETVGNSGLWDKCFTDHCTLQLAKTCTLRVSNHCLYIHVLIKFLYDRKDVVPTNDERVFRKPEQQQIYIRTSLKFKVYYKDQVLVINFELAYGQIVDWSKF